MLQRALLYLPLEVQLVVLVLSLPDRVRPEHGLPRQPKDQMPQVDQYHCCNHYLPWKCHPIMFVYLPHHTGKHYYGRRPALGNRVYMICNDFDSFASTVQGAQNNDAVPSDPAIVIHHEAFPDPL